MGGRLDLGVGLMWFAGTDHLWPDVDDLVDVIEVEPQTLWVDSANTEAPWRVRYEVLEELASRPQPRLAHGVGFPVGGVRSPDPAGTALFADCARRLGAVMASEHLAFNEAVIAERAVAAGYLLPPRQTPAMVEVTAEHIGAYQRLLDVPFAVETAVNYLAPDAGELADGRYTRLVAERADCGILLDLHNVYCNQRNGRQSVVDFIADLPLERVVEVHLAGGFEVDGYWLDGHTGPVPPELVALTAEVLPQLPNLRAVIFEILSPSVPAMGVAGLRRQLEQLHRLAEKPATRRRRSTGGSAIHETPPANGLADAARWEQELLGYTTRRSDQREDGDPGTDLLRLLTDQARLARVTSALPLTAEALVLDRGRPAAHRLLVEYLREEPPHPLARAEALAFAEWLGERLEPGVPAEVLRLEVAAFNCLIDGTEASVGLRIDPTDLREAVRNGRLPELEPEQRYVVTVSA